MIVRTCLLISDDPDDHIEFSEALYEISDDVVLVTVSDIKKALDLLGTRKCVPDFIFLNLGISGFDPKEFLKVLDDDSYLSNVKVVAYGECESSLSARVSSILDINASYSELKEALKKVIGQR